MPPPMSATRPDLALERSHQASRAAAYEATLEAGLVRVVAIVRWADAVVAREVAPPWTICELALLGSRPTAAVVEALRTVEGPREPALIEAFVAADVLERLLAEPHRSAFYAEMVDILGEANALAEPALLDVAARGWRDAIEADYLEDDPQGKINQAELSRALSQELAKVASRLG